MHFLTSVLLHYNPRIHQQLNNYAVFFWVGGSEKTTDKLQVLTDVSVSVAHFMSEHEVTNKITLFAALTITV